MYLRDEDLINKPGFNLLLIYDFNLVLPDKDVFFKYLIKFNEDQRINHDLEFLPNVEFDGEEASLFVLADYGDGDPLCYVTGETDPTSLNGEFHVHPDFYDVTEDGLAYKYIEYLCRAFKGTLVGVYVKNDCLVPIKIIHGNNIPVKLALLDIEDEDDHQ